MFTWNKNFVILLHNLKQILTGILDDHNGRYGDALLLVYNFNMHSKSTVIESWYFFFLFFVRDYEHFLMAI